MPTDIDVLLESSYMMLYDFFIAEDILMFTTSV